MDSNVIGRVKNTHLPKSHGLLPLFEAIINSIDAIEERLVEPSQGRLDIYIVRNPTLLSSEEIPLDQRYKDPISAFTLTDNGIGFTDKNFHAFNEADSLNKANKGGKGVGRFIWLKAFSSAQITSIFQENGSIYKRYFEFSLKSPNGVIDHVKEKIENNDRLQTKILLNGFIQDYETTCPKNASTIGQRIVEHCLSYFLLGKMPETYLHDSNEEVIDLWTTYSELVESENRQKFEINKNEFELIHFRLHPYGDIKHHICFCANERVVKTEQLTTRLIPNLPSIISDNGNAFIYAGYLLSDFLDQNVNQYRTDFNLSQENGLPFKVLSYQDIFSSTLKYSTSFLLPFTKIVQERKVEKISDYVNQNAPQYRHILKNHPERLDQIPVDMTDNKLDSQLYEISRDIEQELREDGQKLINSEVNPNDEKSEQEYLNTFDRWWKEYNDIGKANLAKYIIHRRIILEMFEKALNMQTIGNYSKEEVIHRIIFPLHVTSDDIPYEQHNLWVIDEKLAYHHYLASDIALKKQEIIESNSASRPDLAIFYNNSFAIVDDEAPYNSGIVIFEFKRPMRNDFKGEENPITQIFNYITEILDGKTKTKDGRLINISQRTPFYCYIISDLTTTLKRQAENYGLKITPDNLGYIGFNPNLGAYIEIIGFEKLLLDAKKRNRILFEKLNLTTH